jgi:hypothetical protein
MFSQLVSSYPVFLAGLLIPFAALGQNVATPSLGYLCDAAGGVRTVFGIPGAATQGPVLPTGTARSKCFISPSNTFAVLEPEDGSGVVVAMLSSPARPKLLEGVNSGANLLAFSPSGKVAVFYYGTGADAYLVTGLPQAPSVSKLDLSAIPSLISSLAVDDAGFLLLAGTVDANNGSLFLMTLASRSLRLLTGNVTPGGIAFIGTTGDALVADGLTGRLIRLAQVGTSAAQSLVSETNSSGIKILRVSRDGKTALLGNPTSRSVTTVNLAAGQVLAIPCDCQVVDFQQMAGNAVFLVGNSDSQVPVAFDADSASPRMVSIPDLISRQRKLTER